jgi:leader peptidase (prepilin peptidase)/N-methyltransferase
MKKIHFIFLRFVWDPLVDVFHPFLIFALAILSLFVGSFLGVVVDRLPVGRSVIRPRSCCLACGTQLQMRDLVPLFSYAILKGCCRKCHAPIPHALPLIELASLGVTIWSLAVVPPAMLPVTLLLGWCLLTLAIIDARHLILPDVLTLPLLLAGLAASLVVPSIAWSLHAIGAAAGIVVFSFIRWVFHWLRKVEGLGWGDVKLFGAAGAWIGLGGLPNTLLIASLAGLIFALVRDRKLEFSRPVPFGTFLCLGIWLTWLYGPIELIS